MTSNPNDRTDEREGSERGETAARLAERVRIADAGERSALERVWSGLELPPPSGTPPGFARRVAALAAARDGNSAAAGWGAPGWIGAVAFAAGIALGALLSAGLEVDASESAEDDVAVEAEESLADATLAAHYLDAVDEEPGATEPDPDAAPGEIP